MQRISTATRVLNKFGAGKDGFTDGDVASGVPSTDLEAALFDNLQEELAGVVETTGVVLNGSDKTQVAKAVRTLSGGVVGAARNARMSVAAASASATFTADELVLETALGGAIYRLAGFNKTVNLATVGVNGMDAGAAPVSGFVALYAIYNPTTAVSALLAVNATGAAAPNVYGGGSMPAGFTASDLVSVWPINGSSQFKVGFQRERTFNASPTIVYTSSTATASYASLSVAGSVPLNAVSVKGYLNPSSSTAGAGVNITLAADASGSDFIYCYGVGFAGVPFVIQLLTPQVFYYTTSLTAGTPTFNIAVTGYSF